MSKFTIFTMIYNEYEQLRQFIESIFNNLNPESYSKILILDDHSNPSGKLREYENYLENTYPNLIRIIKFDEYRRIHEYSNKIMEQKKIGKRFKYNEFTDEEPNLGIVRSFHLGAKEIDTEYTFFCHVDTFFTKNAYNMLTEVEELFETHPKCQAMGQLWGVDDKNDPIEYFSPFEFYYSRDGHNIPHGGLVASIFGFFRTDMLNKIRIAASDRPGNTFTHYSRELYKAGYSIINYPCFSKLQIIHLGRGIVRRLTHPEEEDIGFTFCKDIRSKGGLDGPRRGDKLLNKMYGWGFINMTNNEYMEYLRTTYKKPFEEIQPTLGMDKIFTTGIC
jgi:hypothetical protein